MEPGFSIAPHKEAADIIGSKSIVSKKVFSGLLPELRMRAFTVAGVEGAHVLQRVQDALEVLPLGGKGVTWDEQRSQIADELEPFLGEEGAEIRAQMLLRVHAFQAFTASTYRAAQADEDTTHLQYIHGDQANVPTPEHEALDGLVLPKDDPFWNNHTGPWGHIGCVCYVRPMNPDMVDQVKEDDADRTPENRNVIEGPALDQLHNGTIIREGRRYDVSPPHEPDAFRWHPNDLTLPIGQLQARYDKDIWAEFQSWAQDTTADIGDTKQTVWSWLMNKPAMQKS